jgi:Protein of unknown function (DUF3108)
VIKSPRALPFFSILFVVVALACTSGDAGPPTSDVVGAPPWSGDQKQTYTLVNKDGEEQGSGILAVVLDGEKTKLVQTYISDAAHDTTELIVDSTTLKPISSSRDIEPASGDPQHIEVQYTDEGALIKQNEDKQSGLSVPEHSYDNDSSLFLWRTLPFAVDYEASYTTIITNRRARQKVNLRVTGMETITVPAGTFETWRLEITTSNARQVAWFADTPERQLVRYDNDRNLIFELTSPP